MMLNGSALNVVVLNGSAGGAVSQATGTITASAVFNGIAAYYASTEGSIAAAGVFLADSAFFYSVVGGIDGVAVFDGISGAGVRIETVGAINAVAAFNGEPGTTVATEADGIIQAAALFTGVSGQVVPGTGVISQTMLMVCVLNDRAWYLVAEPEIHALDAWSQYNLSVDIRRYSLVPDFVEAA